jgi:GTP-binding protein HflX
MARLQNSDVVFISAAKKLHVDQLRDVLYERVRQIHITRFPHNDFLFPME